MANTTTAAQRRDRRRELEAKYGLRSARAMAANNLHRRSPENRGFLPNRFDVFFLHLLLLETRLLLSSSSTDDDPLLDSTGSHSEPHRADNFGE